MTDDDLDVGLMLFDVTVAMGMSGASIKHIQHLHEHLWLLHSAEIFDHVVHALHSAWTGWHAANDTWCYTVQYQLVNAILNNQRSHPHDRLS